MQPHGPDKQVLDKLISELDQNELETLANEFPELFAGSPAVLDLSRAFIVRLKAELHTAFVNEVPPFDRKWFRGLNSIAEIAKDNDLPDVYAKLKQIHAMCFPES